MMPERVTTWIELFFIALMLAAGGLGGVSGAAYAALKGRKIGPWLVAAYFMIGLLFSAAFYVLEGRLFTITMRNDMDMLATGILVGFTGAIMLSFTKLSARFILRQFGFDVKVEVTRIDKSKRDG